MNGEGCVWGGWGWKGKVVWGVRGKEGEKGWCCV